MKFNYAPIRSSYGAPEIPGRQYPAFKKTHIDSYNTKLIQWALAPTEVPFYAHTGFRIRLEVR